jgi:hypothetical protein
VETSTLQRIKLLYTSTNPCLGIYSKEIYSVLGSNIYSSIFIAALFPIAKT